MILQMFSPWIKTISFSYGIPSQFAGFQQDKIAGHGEGKISHERLPFLYPDYFKGYLEPTYGSNTFSQLLIP